MVQICAVAACLSLAASARGQNLLTNPDFEQVPGNQQGQGILPTDWVQVQPSVDTYSNDGSFGLPPSGFNNFPGVLAFSGIRWVAGWSSLPEIFGQTLAATLVPGRTYVLRARLRIAERTDLRSPGTYDISVRGPGQAPISLGRLGDFVEYGEGWVERQLVFLAPAGAEGRPLLAFTPVTTPGGSSYIGCDFLRLDEGCPADFNADGVVNSQDFFDFLVAFFAQSPPADFNEDDSINSQDFFDFLTTFFSGC
jgi:hypothetical protein